MLSEAKILTTLNCNSGHCHIPIEDHYRDETALVLRNGLFSFLQKLFELTNSHRTFQRSIDVVLSSVRWIFAVVYLYDTNLFLKTIVEHMAHPKIILRFVKDRDLMLSTEVVNLSKSFRLHGSHSYYRIPACPFENIQRLSIDATLHKRYETAIIH